MCSPSVASIDTDTSKAFSEQMLDEAGFDDVHIEELEHDFTNYYYLSRIKPSLIELMSHFNAQAWLCLDFSSNEKSHNFLQPVCTSPRLHKKNHSWDSISGFPLASM